MNILLYGSVFFGYVERVSKFLIKKGHNVTIIYSYQFSNLDRFINRVNINFVDQNVRNYINNSFDHVHKDEFDVVLMMGGRGLKKYELQSLKKKLPNARFLLYLSADLEEHSFEDGFTNFFDKVFTYSMYDADKYNFFYLNWFYTDNLLLKKDISLSFIGSLHKSRLHYLSEFQKIDTFYNYIFADKLTHFRNVFQWKNFYNNIYSKELQYSEYIKILARSIATLDLPDKNQKNITTRPIEALATKTKIITTCKSIENYDFYNQNNILILNESYDLTTIKNWLELPYKNLEEPIINKYNISNWIDELLN